MNKIFNIIIGILFYPYGLYLIYVWYKENKKLKDDEIEIQVEEKVKESIEVLKEETSDELIRIILKIDDYEFWCFEFKKDSIKVFKLCNIFSEEKWEGSPCFIEKFDKKFDKQLHESWSIPSENRCSDFYIESRSSNEIGEYFYIRYRRDFSDGSGGTTRLPIMITKPDEVKVSKVDKIVYFFNNITSHKDMISLNESYLKYNSEIVEEKESFINELDVDGDGVIDISKNTDFSKLLKTKQKILIEFEKSEGKLYIQNFVKLSKFLNDKCQNIQSLFEKLKEEESNIPHSDYLDYVGVIRNQIHTYNLMLISSLNMIVSLVDDDRITFYEIYETFDKLNVFSSNHEKEISMKLDNIENKLKGIIQSIHEMEINICNELMNLQFFSEDISEGINGLSRGLSEINSQLNTNNILTGIQTYQLYKINKNTRGLRE